MELKDIKKDDILIYTEMPYSNYANSLNKVIEKEGKLYPSPLVIQRDDKYVAFTNTGYLIPIQDFFSPKDWIDANDFTMSGLSPIEYMNKKMPLLKKGTLDK